MKINWTIVWLDSSSGDLQGSFRQKLGPTLQTFTDVSSCVDYIRSNPCQSIYFIVSGSFARTVVPQIFSLANVIQIYLFCGSVSAYCEWGIDYSDKLLIFDHGDDILERLWNDLDFSLREHAASCLKEAQQMRERALQYQQKCG